GHPALVVLDVAPLVDPRAADRVEPGVRVAAGPAGVVEADRLVRRVEGDLGERHAHVVAGPRDVGLAADAHGSITPFAGITRIRFGGRRLMRPLSPVARAPACL